MVSTTANNSNRGRRLRRERESAGITRAQLAELADCSIASLGYIEQGAVPRRSAVLDAAFAALENLNDERASAAEKPRPIKTNGTGTASP